MNPNNEAERARQKKKKIIVCAAAAAAAAVVAAVVAAYVTDYVDRHPYRGEGLRGLAETERIIGVSDETCRSIIRMNRHAFFNLCALVRDMGLLNDSLHVSLEEKMCVFLYTIGHNGKNRQCVYIFGRSGQTISMCFNQALNAITKLYPILLQPPSTTIPPKIRNNPGTYHPYFKDCIGAIDGTHIPAWVPTTDHQRFRDRKGSISQNILAACDFDMKFTYALARWEGSTADSCVLDDALTRRGEAKLVVHPGKYYLVDAGFANQVGFLRPYRNVRYHLKEWRNTNQSPTNMKELFNMRHSQLRNVIERAFGLLKSRFKILKNQPEYKFDTQVKIDGACILMHNYILRHGRMHDDDDFFAREAAAEIAAAARTSRRGVANPEEGTGGEDYMGENIDDEEEDNVDWGQFRENLATQMWNDWIARVDEYDGFSSN